MQFKRKRDICNCETEAEKGEVVSIRKGPLLCLPFYDKKYVIVLTTQGTANMVTLTSNRGREHTEPEVTTTTLWVSILEILSKAAYLK